MFPKSLPYINFVLATSSLTFQLVILYPWHLQLDEGFTKLKAESTRQLTTHISHHDQQLGKIEGHLTGLLDGLKKAGAGAKGPAKEPLSAVAGSKEAVVAA